MDEVLGILARSLGGIVVFVIVGELFHAFLRGDSKTSTAKKDADSETSPAEEDALVLAATRDSQSTVVPWNSETLAAWEELHGLIQAKPRQRFLELRSGGYTTYLGTKTQGVIDQTTVESRSMRVISQNAWSRADAGVSQWPVLQAVLQKAREHQQH